MRVSFKTGIQDASWRQFVEFWQAADESGRFVAGWVNDHLYNPWYPEYGDSRHSYEAFTALAALANATSGVQLGTMVAANLFRHPAVLMKMAVTVDHISGGRFQLGVGAGWHESEHAQHGIDLLSPRGRLDALEETCKILVGLRRCEEFSFVGEHYQISEALHDPAPIGPMPLVIGGAGEKRTMRIVATYADHWNLDSSDMEVFKHKVGVFNQHCFAVGRDPDEVEVSVQMWVPSDMGKMANRLAEVQAAGVRHAVLAFKDPSLSRLSNVVKLLS